MVLAGVWGAIIYPPVLSLEMLSYAPAGYPPYPDVARGCDQTVGNWVPAAA